MRPVELIALLIGAAVLAAIGYLIAAMHYPQPDKPLVEYKDFVGILLTALTAAIAVLALGIATLAVWGFQVFENKVKEASEQVANEHLGDYLNSTPFAESLSNKVDEAVRARVLAAATVSPAPQATAHATGTTIPSPPPS